ncbi:Ppx/GppA phosphatase family protein [Alicyclobacillus mengziensis]|uniref:Ppx/GppA family phosphatase n=1 Tax=Alicyclobacillus mengziensis TaxID=2931921 RepID=A0A9X7VZ71_9BACL|nr:Ppx/GppA phosphatase family protein [Alicyclobacillus mengziensis]QSO47771.1 Ppx/GppA family phosphatase [Alicyclobacillus mengziensis]
MTDELNAVMDLGSNSVRLVIYQQGPHGTQQELDNLKQTVRLSSHLDSHNMLSEKGIQRTVRIISQFKQLCDAYGVTRIVGVATQAVRMAVNRDTLLQRITEHTGIEFRVVSGQEEAHYGYLAVVNSIPFEQGVTIDIGGGSTEITYFQDRKLVYSTSIPYGAVSLTREAIHSDPPTAKDLKALEKAILSQLEQHSWLKDLNCPVIGMGGTARSVGRIHQRQRDYPLNILHGYAMRPAEVTAILDMVRSLPVEKRSETNGLSGDRADIIIAGMTILDQVLKHVDGTEFVISNKGLRDGVLMEQVLQTLNQTELPDMLMYSIQNIHDHFRLNDNHAFHVWKLAEQLLFDLMEYRVITDNYEASRCLQVAALLHDIGRTISIYNARNHNFYLLLQVPLLGITHRERVLAAAIAAFKTTKQITAVLADYQEFLTEEDVLLISQLGTVLGLARMLDRTESKVVKDIHLVPKTKGFVLRVKADKPLHLELELASDWLKKWRKTFQSDIRLEVEQID